jgi:HEPN domain-containing protein
VKEKVQEWIELARIDQAAAEKLLGSEPLSSAASFHAHQCIEKSFKAVMEHTDVLIPKIHDLVRLHHEVKDHLGFECDKDMLDDLSKLYIDSRYPAMMGHMPYGRPSIGDAKRYVDFAGELLKKIVRFCD